MAHNYIGILTTQRIDEFVSFYNGILWEIFAESIIPNEGINSSLLLDKGDLYKPEYEMFCNFIRNEVFSYKFDENYSIN